MDITITEATLRINGESFALPEYKGTTLPNAQKEINKFREQCYREQEETLGPREERDEMTKKPIFNFRMYFEYTEINK
jgi:hypothetical protein